MDKYYYEKVQKENCQQPCKCSNCLFRSNEIGLIRKQRISRRFRFRTLFGNRQFIRWNLLPVERLPRYESTIHQRKSRQSPISRSKIKCVRTIQHAALSSIRSKPAAITHGAKPNCANMNNTIRLAVSRGLASEVMSSGCVFSHSARALRAGSIPAFPHHVASSPER